MSDVRVRREGACGRITLNRPQAMNALTLEMVRAIDTALRGWATEPEVAFVLLDAAGERGLCAGGDIRALYRDVKAGDFAAATTFVREEYRLNYLIARYPKPYVALMDGVVMGGGIGVSAHGSHRAVTERSVLAMPEVGIGFVPDVGGTYLLGAAPGELGTYLALTGGRIGAADAILCGLADAYVSGESVQAFLEAVVACGSRAAMEACLRSLAKTPPTGRLERSRGWIDACFGGSSVETILQALRGRAEEEAHATAAEIAKNSPTSLKLALHALRRARELNELEACLQQEYVLAQACMREGDFVEGVRAAVVDKDRQPRWQPATLEEVTPERVAAYFAGEGLPPLALGEVDPLQSLGGDVHG